MKNRLACLGKLDLQTIVIILLIIIILLMKMCKSEPVSGPKEIIKVEGKKYEVIKRVVDTQYLTTYKTVYKPGKIIYKDSLVYVTVQGNVDTSAILKDYYTRFVYSDTLKLDDSLGMISLVDTVEQNRISGRKWSATIREKKITDSIFIKELPKNQLYVGPLFAFDQSGVVNFAGPIMTYKTKKDQMYNLGVGINNNKSATFLVGFSYKIRLKKN